MQDSRTLWLVWLSAALLAILAIRLLIVMSPTLVLSDRPTQPLEIDVVLGSSLSKTLLPPYQQAPSLMNDHRDTDVVSVPGATALETLEMLEWAIHHTRGDIAIEVNAFTLQFSHFSIPAFPWLTAALENQRRIAASMTFTAKQLVGVTPGEVRYKQMNLGRAKKRFAITTREPKANLSYLPQSFLYPRELKAQIRRLAREDRKVVFIWPPAPESGTGSNLASWHRAREHVVEFCLEYKVDCWLPTAPWPDDLFRDLWGHLGPSGRDRFAEEFTDWWDENG